MRNGALLSKARENLKGNFWRAVLILFLTAVIPGFITAMAGRVLFEAAGGIAESPSLLDTGLYIGPLLLQGTLLLLNWLLASLLAVGEKWSYLDMTVDDNGKLKLKTVFKSFRVRSKRNIWHNILKFLLILFWSVLGILLAGAGGFLTVQYFSQNTDLGLPLTLAALAGVSAFFIAVAVFWLVVVRYWFILSEFVLSDPKYSAYQALQKSRQLIKGHKWQLFQLAVRIFFPLVLLSVLLPLVVGALSLVIQEQVWIIGLLAVLSAVFLGIYALAARIRWKAVLAIFFSWLVYLKETDH